MARRGSTTTVLVPLTLVVLASAQSARAAQNSEEPDFGEAMENVEEVAHQVQVTTVRSGWAVATVTHTFEARQPSSPVALLRGFDLPGEAVVTSLVVDTNGTWRRGRLGRRHGGSERRGRAPTVVGDGRPWAALEWLTGHQAQIETPMFRTTRRFAVRYAISSRGEAVRGGHRWVFCPDEPDDPSPEVSAPSSTTPGTKQEVRDSDEAPGCRELITTEPPPTKLVPRYASYRVGPRSWLWRVELRAPASLLPVPPPPQPGPVVFVLDASRSQEANGGLATQLAIVRAYVTNAPHAEVELLLVSRTVERVFGRLLPAAEVERALPQELARRPLGNGSFLDRGVVMAAEMLSRAGRPGRVVLMTDGQLRSAFDVASTMVALRRAPAGTVVHLVFPGAWTDAQVEPWDPEQLAAIPAAFGGASYSVSVGKKRVNQPTFAALARRLVWPTSIESLALQDLSARDRPEWPAFPGSPFFGSDGELEAGQERAWSAVSAKAPPGHLALTGQIWSRKLDLRLRPDPSLARELPRLATADDDVMNCSSSEEQHGAVALADGFLAPGLLFWVQGTGERNGSGTDGLDAGCGGGLGGHGSGAPRPPRQELPRALVEAIATCGLIASSAGDVAAKVETQGDEILDVTITGAGDPQRRCAEEALWNGRLPETFNAGRWGREVYQLRLARAPSR